MRSAARRRLLRLAICMLGTGAFPSADSGYHDHAEVVAKALAVANAYPSIVGRP